MLSFRGLTAESRILKKPMDPAVEPRDDTNCPQPIFINFFLATLCLLFPRELDAVSFDCKKASNWLEKAICQQFELGKLDDELSVAYKEALKKTKNPKNVRKEQRQWLRHLITDKNVEGRCTYEGKADNYCIGIFKNRIAELKAGDAVERLGDCRDDKIVSKHGRFKDTYDDTAIIEFQSGLTIYVDRASQEDKPFPIKKKFSKSNPQEYSEQYQNAVGNYVIETQDFMVDDKVTICLIDKPACPIEDDRGKKYSIRSHKNPTNVLQGINSWHMCGGA